MLQNPASWERQITHLRPGAKCTRTHKAQNRDALKGTNLRGQTEPKRRSSQMFADSRLFLGNEAFGKRRFSQKTAGFRRKPQKTAGTRRKPQIGVCPLRFVPLSAALQKSQKTAPNNYLNTLRGLPGHYPVKQGFWGKSHQKVHPNVRQYLCHTVSLWYLFCPRTWEAASSRVIWNFWCFVDVVCVDFLCAGTSSDITPGKPQKQNDHRENVLGAHRLDPEGVSNPQWGCWPRGFRNIQDPEELFPQ